MLTLCHTGGIRDCSPLTKGMTGSSRNFIIHYQTALYAHLVFQAVLCTFSLRNGCPLSGGMILYRYLPLLCMLTSIASTGATLKAGCLTGCRGDLNIGAHVMSQLRNFQICGICTIGFCSGTFLVCVVTGFCTGRILLFLCNNAMTGCGDNNLIVIIAS